MGKVGSSDNSIHQEAPEMSEEEKDHARKGALFKNPFSGCSYTIKWPKPTLMYVLIIKKPNDAQIDGYTRKIIE